MLQQDKKIFHNHPELVADLLIVHNAWIKIRIRRQRLFKEIKIEE